MIEVPALVFATTVPERGSSEGICHRSCHADHPNNKAGSSLPSDIQ